MTQAEYEKKYGTPPPASTPTQMTQAQYDAKYPSAPTEPQPYGNASFADTMANSIVNAGIGVGKQVASLPFNLANIGKNIGNTMAKIPGLGFLGTKAGSPSDLSTQVPDVLKTVGTAQAVGSGIADVAEFFIPGGAEEKAGTSIDKMVDTAKFAEKFGSKAGEALGGILKVIGKGAVTGASMAGVTGVQTGGDVGKMETAAKVGGIAGAAGKVLDIFGKPIADALQKASLKVPPQKSASLGSKVDDAASWLTDNVGMGTPNSQYAETTNIINGYEKTLQDFLSTTAEDKTVAKSDLISQLEGLKSNFTDERDSLAIDKQIDGAINTIKVKQPDQIPLTSLNTLKRSTYTSAYNKAGDKVVDWVEAYIGNVFKGSIEDATKGLTIDGQDIASFNKEYGNALTAKSLLKLSKGKQVGLSGKALLLLLGSGAGLPGEAAGLLMGGKTGIGGLAATGLGSMAQGLGSTVPTAAKIGAGVFNSGGQQQ